MTAAGSPSGGPDGLAAAVAAVRVRLGLVLLLLALAGAGWWWTVRRMAGMAGGPWATLGSIGWFIGMWTVMMAAMMLPSLAPTVALYARMARARTPAAPLAFTAGYLLVWGGAGAVAWVLAEAATSLGGGALSWDRAGRPLAVATLLLAAVYECTPLKDVCLGKCRSPLGFLLGTWRDGWRGGLLMGCKHATWCIGCCWALMAALFALGVMNVVWMASVAGLIAVEKTLPWRRTATYSTAAVLACLGGLTLIAPDALPWLVQPGADSMSPGM